MPQTSIKGFWYRAAPRRRFAAGVDHQITELCVHAWDLTKAAQLSVTLDDELAEHALAWSRQMLQPQFRGQGKAFGNEVPVPADATAYDRLAGWFGREPGWQPPRPAST